MSRSATNPGKLHIIGAKGNSLQFGIQSDYNRLKGEWDDIYFDVSGFFGSYGPHMFAAAPDMIKALEHLEEVLSGEHVEIKGHVDFKGGVLEVIRTALARARPS